MDKKIELSVVEAKRKIELLRYEDSLVFPMFTDLHTEDENHEYTKRLTSVLSQITAEIDCNAVINLGDNFGMLGRDIHITNEELSDRFERVLSAMHSSAGCPIINVNGNHDALGTDFFKPDFWNSIVRGKYGNDMAVYSDEGSYYYIDYDSTRLVILSLPCDSDIECDMPTPIWKFGEKQLDWLKSVALDTDKYVIILSHVPFYDKYVGDMEATLGVWTGTEAKVSYIYALCGWIEDVAEAGKIIGDFKERHPDKLVACLSGHTHADGLWEAYEKRGEFENPLPCSQVVTTSACFTEDKNLKMEMGICVDIVVWSPSKKELNLIRVGDGCDRKVKLYCEEY